VRNPLRSAAAILSFCVFAAPVPSCFAQSSDLPHFGAGLKVSTLGVGIEAATGITRRSNVRVGFNAFGYNYNFNKDGIDYATNLQLRSVQATYDWFLGGFHLSPGLLLYNGNKLGGAASVSGGRSFTLSGNQYFSNPADPVAGTANFELNKNKVAPMVLFGFGNLLPRSSRRFSVSFDTGVVFMGSPQSTLNLTGSTCTASGLSCQDIATNATIQANIQSEQQKISKSLKPFQFYPVISIGVGYKLW